MEGQRYPGHLVFGLDIGTRSLVGTVGYKDDNKFKVVAQCVKEHETRAMLDGQIHDIPKVSESIRYIKDTLEKQIGRKITNVCIAAAGRVLKTITINANVEFQSETVITKEHIHSLDLLGVEKAYDEMRDETKEDSSDYYCVGYSPVRYYLNNYIITNLEGHKAGKIGVELLATFLPDEVIDSLYIAVEKAGLLVSSLTLEPIAAINIAIPDKFRLLNIALVDVGAGTSDISITKDGSIIAYGMIPYAGDEITENISQNYLVEFSTAEKMKAACLRKRTVSYKDIMGISHKIMPEEILQSVENTVEKITKGIADKIMDLNGGKTVSAVFLVGGGGKIPTFVTSLAEHLGLPKDRVALRGVEVLNDVEILQQGIKKDPLIVTPIGICLNFYKQTNNFITVTVNEERVKLYDNSKLTIADAALQVGFPNEKLFPRRGKAINFTVDGGKRFKRGELGEAAQIALNGKTASFNTPISQNDKIDIKESTKGADAVYEIRQLPEYESTITFYVNGKNVICPKLVMVDNELVSEFYSICDGDNITILNYYTLEQVLEFMDIEPHGQIEVNHVVSPLTEKVYENFTIDCNIKEWEQQEENTDIKLNEKPNESKNYIDESSNTRPILKDGGSLDISFTEANKSPKNHSLDLNLNKNSNMENSLKEDNKEIPNAESLNEKKEIHILVNNKEVTLSGKDKYIFVDILDFYYFNTKVASGNSLIQKVNGETADFTTPIHNNDIIELYWK